MFEISLTPEAMTVLLILSYILGVGIRITWPYAVAYMTEPQSFDWQKVKGQLIGAAVGLVGVILSGMLKEGFVEGLGALGFIGSVVAGYTAASVGRNAQKTIDLRNK